MVNAPKHCPNLKDSPFTILIDLWEVNYPKKKCLLVICKISKMFPNTLGGDGKYFLLDRENLMQPIQKELSRKQKPLS